MVVGVQRLEVTINRIMSLLEVNNRLINDIRRGESVEAIAIQETFGRLFAYMDSYYERLQVIEEILDMEVGVKLEAIRLLIEQMKSDMDDEFKAVKRLIKDVSDKADVNRTTLERLEASQVVLKEDTEWLRDNIITRPNRPKLGDDD